MGDCQRVCSGQEKHINKMGLFGNRLITPHHPKSVINIGSYTSMHQLILAELLEFIGMLSL
jgi:hypothetical protein